MAAWNHKKCAKHVKVAGFRRPVCILPGQDEREVVAFATEIGKRAREAGLPFVGRTALTEAGVAKGTTTKRTTTRSSA